MQKWKTLIKQTNKSVNQGNKTMRPRCHGETECGHRGDWDLEGEASENADRPLQSTGPQTSEPSPSLVFVVLPVPEGTCDRCHALLPAECGLSYLGNYGLFIYPQVNKNKDKVKVKDKDKDKDKPVQKLIPRDIWVDPPRKAVVQGLEGWRQL